MVEGVLTCLLHPVFARTAKPRRGRPRSRSAPGRVAREGHTASGHRQASTSLEAGRRYPGDLAREERDALALLEEGPLIRQELASRMRMAERSVTWVVDRLLSKGLAVETGEYGRTRSGNKAKLVAIAGSVEPVKQESML